jgi:hypothetical protein
MSEAVQHFSVPAMAEAYAAVYDQTLGRGRWRRRLKPANDRQ